MTPKVTEVHIRPIHGSTADTPQLLRTVCGQDVLRGSTWIYASSLPRWDLDQREDPLDASICPRCRMGVETATQGAPA